MDMMTGTIITLFQLTLNHKRCQTLFPLMKKTSDYFVITDIFILWYVQDVCTFGQCSVL